MARAPRLIDLHCPWPLQYAGETTDLAAEDYPGVAGRLRQVDGYLSATRAAVVACTRSASDWARRADPWRALGELIARVEAEFAGRLLIGPDDRSRWLDDPDSPCWALIGVSGFEALVREPSDLTRLAPLFDRGVRVFQPVSGGSIDLGRGFLETLAGLPTGGPRPVLDLAGMGAQAVAETLAWFEAEPERAARLIPICSRADVTEGLENLGRLKALGGVVGFRVGPPDFEDADRLKGAVEAVAGLGDSGFKGLAIATGFLTVDAALPGLGRAEEVAAWLLKTFDRPTADALAFGNGAALIDRALGVESGPH